MNAADWIVLLGSLGFIVLYGAWKTRRQVNLESYLRGDRDTQWLTVGLSVMATQASAITFLSTPGQAFDQDMGFIQIYFGLPIALVLVSIFIVPLFHRLNVYTAYEFLESRFDLKTRLLTASLFLLQRGLAAGITIYAPSIVLNAVLGWDINTLNIIIGLLVVVYTVIGGTKAVNVTQKLQMGVILAGMAFAFYVLVDYITRDVTLTEAFAFAGDAGKLELIDFELDFSKRYNLWSGLLGGIIISLSYFGADQSQVQRYIHAKSIRESRMGLMFNAVLKIPMQFMILLTGVLLYVFFALNPAPINFKSQVLAEAVAQDATDSTRMLIARYEALSQQAEDHPLDLERIQERDHVRRAFQERAEFVVPGLNADDADYVFIQFVLHYLPHGLIGLLLAVILSAGMSSTAGELNALSATTMNDFLVRLRLVDRENEAKSLFWSKAVTVLWGMLAILVALLANQFENLIELVNLIGSLFYGTVLGIFLCALWPKKWNGTAVFLAGFLSEALVLSFFALRLLDEVYLYYNVIGCGSVLILTALFQRLLRK